MLDAGAGNFAFHADAFGRRADDYRIPRYPYLPPRDQTLPFNGRQPNSAHALRRPVGRRLLHLRQRLCRRRGVANSRASIAFPGMEATETNTRIDMNQTKVTSQRRIPPAGRRHRGDPVLARRTPTTSTTSSPTKAASTASSRPSPTRSRKAASRCSSLPFDLRFAHADDRARRAGHAPAADRAGRRRRPVRSQPHHAASPASCSTSSGSATTLRMQVAGRIEQAQRDRRGAGPVSSIRSIEHRRATATSRRRAAPSASCRTCRGTSSAASPRNMSSARRARRSCSRAACTRRPRPSTSAIRTCKIEAAKTVEIGLRRAARAVPLRGDRLLHALRRLHLPQPDRRDLRRDVDTCTGAPFCGAGGELNQAIYSQRDATFRGGEFQSQLDVAPLWGGMLGHRGAVRHRARDLHRRHQRAAHPAAARSAAACSGATPTGSRASACCTPSRRTTSPAGETHDRRLQPAQGRARATPRRCDRNDFGGAQLTVGVAGNNLLERRHPQPRVVQEGRSADAGRGVRFFATLKN